MAVTVTHTKVCNIPDNQTNLARGEVCPSHWNADHTLAGMTELLSSLQDIEIINMQNADLTLTFAQACKYALILLNVGDGTKTLTWPSSADSYYSRSKFIYAAPATNSVTLAMESGGTSATIKAGQFSEVVFSPGVAVNIMSHEYARQARQSHAGINYVGIGDYTFFGTDAGKVVVSDDSNPSTYTVPLGDYTMPENMTIYLSQIGAGNVTIAGDVGVNVYGDLTMTQNQSRKLCRDGVTDEWYCL